MLPLAGRSSAPHNESGFTLLELMTAVVIIAILVTLLMPMYGHLKARADRATCARNLSGLYAGAEGYLQEQGHWPQIDTKNLQSPIYAKAWVEALGKYGIGHKNWICPSVQRELREPDYTKAGSERVDYIATPFDSKPLTPHKWATQPWFMERGNVHGDGQLVIFANGNLKSLNEVVRDAPSKSLDW